MHIKFYGATSYGIVPSPDKVDAITNFPRPSNVKELQDFIGMVNFYHRFVTKAAEALRPFHCMLQGTPSKQTQIIWSPALEEAFKAAKSGLAEATMLVHPKPDALISLTTDASDTAVGAVMQQWVEPEPLAFFSRKLRNPEIQFSAYDKGLLAIKLACRHFCYQLEGRDFPIYTDHKPLTTALEHKSPLWNAWLAEVIRYTTAREVSRYTTFPATGLSFPEMAHLWEKQPRH